MPLSFFQPLSPLPLISRFQLIVFAAAEAFIFADGGEHEFFSFFACRAAILLRFRHDDYAISFAEMPFSEMMSWRLRPAEARFRQMFFSFFDC
jgi:hypothetical protein